MKRILLRMLAGLLLAAALFYAADYAWLRVRVGRNAAFDTVQVEIVDQIPQKGNKAEYVPQEPQMQTCVRSILPHLGDQPCWYLRRHSSQQVNF
ncbi:MAG TPA: hypothetical protein VGL89_14460 [Candidatus Koribacter sp.]|jgi:hypothetical protein